MVTCAYCEVNIGRFVELIKRGRYTIDYDTENSVYKVFIVSDFGYQKFKQQI